MTCPACGAPAKPWFTAPGSEPRDQTEYELARCETCSTAVTLGPPADAAAYAGGIYADRTPRLVPLLERVQAAVLRLPLRLLRRAGVLPGARVLDAGAGRGRLVAALAARGYNSEGIDAAPRGGDVARAEIGGHEASDLDAVVLWHVLEHLGNPDAALERIRGWLRPGGVLLVAVPNAGSLQAHIAGARWFHLDLPRHRTHFTPAGLVALLGHCGYRVERVRHLVPEHNFHGMWFALLGRLGMTPGFPFHLVKRNAPLRPADLALVALAGPLLLPFAVVLEAVAAAARRGGTVAVTARRHVQGPSPE